MECDAFSIVDSILLEWIVDRLFDEDVGAKLGELDLLTVCMARAKKHFGHTFKAQYDMLSSTYYVITAAKYSCPDAIEDIIAQYLNKD